MLTSTPRAASARMERVRFSKAERWMYVCRLGPTTKGSAPASSKMSTSSSLFLQEEHKGGVRATEVPTEKRSGVKGHVHQFSPGLQEIHMGPPVFCRPSPTELPLEKRSGKQFVLGTKRPAASRGLPLPRPYWLLDMLLLLRLSFFVEFPDWTLRGSAVICNCTLTLY